MGIRLLNRYLKENVGDKSIKSISLWELKNKKIVIDTSIYLYKLKNGSTQELEKNFNLLINLFRSYNITPIFVFDGIPPKEKLEILDKREEVKSKAELNIKLLEE